jgi:hypothetical protein
VKNVVWPASDGPIEVLGVPRPTAGPSEVLVRTVTSVSSPGTERAPTALPQSSLPAKVQASPGTGPSGNAQGQSRAITATMRATIRSVERAGRDG